MLLFSLWFAASPIVRPRAADATSIPGLIKLFQDEWDASVLETYKLREYVHKLRQELSHTVYQHDAACRVIARLTRERDEARAALGMLKPSAAAMAVEQPAAAAAAGGPADGSAMETDDAAAAEAEDDGMTAAVLSKITSTSKTLSKARKKRVGKPEGMATAEEIKGYAEASSFSGLHSASSGVTCMSVGNPNDSFIMTGSSDKTATLFDTAAGKVVGKMKGHKKKVTGVILHPAEGADTGITCSADKTVKIWQPSTGECRHTISTHTDAVTGISLHPVQDYFLSVSADKHWGFNALTTGKTLAYCTDSNITAGYSCTEIHPDGKIFAAGTTDNKIHIWDIKNQKLQLSLAGHADEKAAVTSMSFSENGYYFATASADATVKLWDLRKAGADMSIHTIKMDDDAKVNDVAFDHTGNYLALASSTVQVYTYAAKKWEHVHTLAAHAKAVTAVAFGPNAKTIYSASMDRFVKLYQ